MEREVSAAIKERMREKEAFREADARALETGEKTREQLRLENHLFAGRKCTIVFPSKPPR